MILRHLEKDVYNRFVTFAYGTVAEINRYIKKHLPEHEQLRPSTRGRWMVRERDGYEADFICIVRVRRPAHATRDNRLATLAHESLHHVGHVLRMSGIQLTEDTEEAYTYYLQFTIERCARLMP